MWPTLTVGNLKKLSSLIYYPAGTYGSFVNWTCRNFKNGNFEELPFLSDGSSHKQQFNTFLGPQPVLDNFLAGNSEIDFVRTHPNNSRIGTVSDLPYAEMIKEDLEFLSLHFRKIIVLYANADSRIWVTNNI